MKALALALATFAGFPAGPTSPYPGFAAVLPTRADTPVGAPDSWIPLDLFPQDAIPTLTDDLAATEASASDEIASDLVQDADPSPHVPLVGCELALSGSLTPESWAREIWLGAPPPVILANGHGEKDGRWIDYEQIPRRPERPEAYTAYRYPLAEAPVVSGYDLDKPDDEQRRGRMRAVGHGGVDLVAEMGAPISMVRLEHQRGDAEVIYVGWLYGETVVTRHVLREGGADRDYLLIFGHLDRAAEGVRRGRHLPEGATVGFVGNTDSPQLVHLHLEARRMRDHVDPWQLPGDALHAREYSIVADPRNVLPLRATPHRAARCIPRLAGPQHVYWLGSSMSLRLTTPG